MELKELISDKFKEFHERYGYKRITKDLMKLGHRVNHKKVVYRLMRELGLKFEKLCCNPVNTIPIRERLER